MNWINEQTTITIPGALRLVGLVGGAWALLVIAVAVLTYLPGHPDFSPWTTYLSDIGDTPVAPQIILNGGVLIAAPMRFLALALVALRLAQFGAGKPFVTAAVALGLVVTFGSILMTAAPFSVAPTVHKSGIGLYFLGVVVLQSLFGLREWSLKAVPRALPVLCLVVVLLFLVFTTLIFLYESGSASRSAPVIWEWLAMLASIAWLFAHSLQLGTSRLI